MTKVHVEFWAEREGGHLYRELKAGLCEVTDANADAVTLRIVDLPELAALSITMPFDLIAALYTAMDMSRFNRLDVPELDSIIDVLERQGGCDGTR